MPDMVLVRPMAGAGSEQLLWPIRQRRHAPRYPPGRVGEPVEDAAQADPGPSLAMPDEKDESKPDTEDEEADELDLLDPLGRMAAEALEVLEGGFGGAPAEEAADGDQEQETQQPNHGGGADGSLAAAPAAPPPEPPAEVRPAKQRRGASATVHLPGGSLSFYASKNAFEAVCLHKDHGRCVMTRTNKAKGTLPDGTPQGGRPIGFLAAWLGRSDGCPSKAAHWAKEEVERPHSERAALRAQFATIPSGRVLLGCERPLANGEASEAASLAGLL